MLCGALAKRAVIHKHARESASTRKRSRIPIEHPKNRLICAHMLRVASDSVRAMIWVLVYVRDIVGGLMVALARNGARCSRLGAIEYGLCGEAFACRDESAVEAYAKHVMYTWQLFISQTLKMTRKKIPTEHCSQTRKHVSYLHEMYMHCCVMHSTKKETPARPIAAAPRAYTLYSTL